MKSEIKTYYDQVAAIYDHDRFGNTYGLFIDRQEKHILENLLQNKQQVLDLGCGTGRLSYLATHGVDISEPMLAIARQKCPEKSFVQASAFELPFEDARFDAVFSMHMVMHLEHNDLEQLLKEVHRVLKPSGQLIFDFPSQKRRNILNTRPKNWHGANEYKIEDIIQQLQKAWVLSYVCGILFLPIHRIPGRLRSIFYLLDNLLCRSFLKNYSSYLLVSLTKK